MKCVAIALVLIGAFGAVGICVPGTTQMQALPQSLRLASASPAPGITLEMIHSGGRIR